MPIYEFHCRACGHDFEAIVRVGASATCPSCQSAEVERELSLFAVSTEESRASSLAGARQRYKRQTKDQQVHEREHVIEHIKEHQDALRKD